MKIKFTREDARRLFDLLPKGKIVKEKIDKVFERRLAVVSTGRGYTYAWLTLPHELVIGFLDLDVKNYYMLKGNYYERLGVVKGTDLLYKEVNHLIANSVRGRGNESTKVKPKSDGEVDKYVNEVTKKLRGLGMDGGMLALKVRQSAMDKFGGSSSQMGTKIQLNIKGNKYEYDIKVL